MTGRAEDTKLNALAHHVPAFTTLIYQDGEVWRAQVRTSELDLYASSTFPTPDAARQYITEMIQMWTEEMCVLEEGRAYIERAGVHPDDDYGTLPP